MLEVVASDEIEDKWKIVRSRVDSQLWIPALN